MADWNTRLEVKLGDRTITPISNFTPTFNVPHTVIHSLERDGSGYVRQPFTFTFTPSSESSRTSGAIDSPVVVVTGILT